jgi:cytochrome c oxidase subunit IV
MRKAMQIGLIVAALLAILTVIEYLFATRVEDDFIRFVGLTVSTFGKAGLILYYFMHIYRLWRPEEAH